MSDQETPSPFESSLPDRLAALADGYRETPDISPKVNSALRRQVRRRRSRGLAVVALAAVVTVGAVVIPAQFSRANTVRNALGSLFSSSTVQFTLSVTSSVDTSSTTTTATPEAGQAPGGGSVGTAFYVDNPLSKYSLQVTVTNPTGGPVSDAADADNIEISVLKGTTDLGDFMVADGAAYLRLNIQALFGNPQSEISSWDQLAQKNPSLAFLSTLAAGGWVGITESSIDDYVTSRGGKAPSPVDVGSLRSSFALSFAQAWDVWTSVKQLSTANGVTEYSLTLPVRNFLGSMLADVTSQLEKTVPSAQRVIPDLTRDIDSISASLTIPMLMWVQGGSMTKLQISHGTSSLVIDVAHPGAGVTPPAGATMITIGDIQSWFGSAFGMCSTSSTVSGNSGVIPSGWTGYAPLSTSPCDCSGSSSLTVIPARASQGELTLKCLGDNGGGFVTGVGPSALGTAAQSNLQTALTGAKVYFTVDNQTFSGLSNTSSSTTSSIQSIDTGLSYVSGSGSIDPHVISTHVGGNGTYVVLTSFALGTDDCWGVYDNTSTQAAAVLGMPSGTGTYFFVIRKSSPVACNAGAIRSVSAWSETGFPPA